MLFLYHSNVMGNLGRVNLSQMGFKPNLIVVCRDSQGGDAIQALVYGRELHWIQLLGEFRVDAKIAFDDLRGHRRSGGRTGGHKKTTQPDSLTGGQSSFGNGTVFKDGKRHPMSVSKPADLG